MAVLSLARAWANRFADLSLRNGLRAHQDVSLATGGWGPLPYASLRAFIESLVWPDRGAYGPMPSGTDHPADAKPGWHRLVQGVTVGGGHWYVSQQYGVWKIPLEHDLSAFNAEAARGMAGIPTDLAAQGYDHFGDPDFDAEREWLLVPLEGAEGLSAAIVVHVEAGIKIKDLLADLAGLGLALPTMGAGGAQSLAGAISTGTHGSDVNLQPLMDAVRAYHLVGPGGQEWWIERRAGFSDAGQLSSMPQWCADTIIKHDDYFYYAALVAAGRMGVLYSIVLEVVPEYWLEEHRITKSWSAVRGQLTENIEAGYLGAGGLFSNNLAGSPLRFFQVVLNPNDKESCWVTERWLTEERAPVAADKGHFDPIVTFCKPAHFTPAVLALIAAASATLALDPLTATAAVILGGIAVGTSETFGDLISKLLNVSPDWLIGRFNGWILDGEHDPAVRRNTSHAILDQGHYERAGCMHGDSAEYFFNADSGRYLEFVDEVFQHAKTAGSIPGYVSLRFTRNSDAFLAMERFPLTVAIEVTSLRPWSANEKYYESVERSALANGGVPHWGQEQAMGRGEVERIYGASLEVFRWIISEIEAFGPGQTFGSKFTRFKGLEPVMLLENYRKQRCVLSELFNHAMQDLELESLPHSIREVANLFPASLRDNIAGEALATGKAHSYRTGVWSSIRLLRSRFH